MSGTWADAGLRVVWTDFPLIEWNWWTAGVVSPSSVIAAYQAKGAASYSASKVNLANPGTHNLSDVVVPSWNATDGWVFTGTEVLNTGLRSAQLGRGRTCSFAIRYSDIPTDNTSHAIIGGQFELDSGLSIPTISTEIRMNAVPPSRGILVSFDEGSSGCTVNSAFGNASGVVFLAGTKACYNGVELLDHDACADSWGAEVDIAPVYIGALNWEFELDPGVYDPYAYYIGKVQAVAFYNSVLTPAQVAAVTAAMQAL